MSVLISTIRAMCYSRQYFAPDNLPHATSSVAIVAVGTHEDILLNAICSAPAYFHKKNTHTWRHTHRPSYLRGGMIMVFKEPNLITGESKELEVERAIYQ